MKKRIILSIGLLTILLVGWNIYQVKHRSASTPESCTGYCELILRSFDTSPENVDRLIVDAVFDEIKTAAALPEGYPRKGEMGSISGDPYAHCIPGLSGQLMQCILLNDQNDYVVFFFHLGPTQLLSEYLIYVLPPWPWINTSFQDPTGRMSINLAVKPAALRQPVETAVRRALAKLGVIRYTARPNK